MRNYECRIGTSRLISAADLLAMSLLLQWGALSAQGSKIPVAADKDNCWWRDNLREMHVQVLIIDLRAIL